MWREFAGESARARYPLRIGDPAQAAGCDAGDLEGDAVAVTEFGGAVFEQLHERAVDVAEAEKAEVE